MILRIIKQDPINRKYHHNKMTFLNDVSIIQRTLYYLYHMMKLYMEKVISK